MISSAPPTVKQPYLQAPISESNGKFAFTDQFQAAFTRFLASMIAIAAANGHDPSWYFQAAAWNSGNAEAYLAFSIVLAVEQYIKLTRSPLGTVQTQDAKN